MIKKRKFPRIFPGWWMVLTGGFVALWGHGYYSYGISALFKPISTDLGFSRAVTSVPTAIGRLEGGVEAPLSGWLTDKFGPRWVIFFGVLVAGISLILMNFIHSAWQFYVVWGVLLGTGVNIALSVPVQTAITNWFVKKRGLALGSQWVGSGLSGTVMVPIIAWLIVNQGWRISCLIGGIGMIVIGLTATWFSFKRHRPEYYGLLPDGAAVEGGGEEARQMIDRGVEYAGKVGELEFTLGQAMKTRGYWMLVTANLFFSLVMSAMNVHVIPFLTDIGIDPVKAATMMAIMIGSGIPSRFIGGLLSDRVKTTHLRFVAGGGYLLQVIGFALYVLNPKPGESLIYFWFILYGVGQGLSIVLIPMMVGRYFGRKAFGSIHGTRQLFTAPFSMVAPVYVGYVYDTTGTYMVVFTAFLISLLFSGIIMFLASPPKPPAKITAIDKIV